MQGRARKGTRAPRRQRLFSGLVRCQQCQRWLHYVMAAGKPRLKCSNLHCTCYGRGLAEWKVRDQVLTSLRGQHAGLARRAAAEPRAAMTHEQLERRQQLEQLLQMRAQGVQGLDQAIEALEAAEILPAPSTPNWASLAELFSRPGVLELATEEELRPILLEFVDEVLYVGNPDTVEVRLR